MAIETIMTQTVTLANALIEESNLTLVLKAFEQSRKEFTLAEDDRLLGNIPKEHGLYFIDVRFPFEDEECLEDFGTQWGLAKSKNEDFPDSPRFYKGKVKSNLSNLNSREFVPFYLGKSKNVQKRLTEHLNDEAKTGTYSLKLKDRNTKTPTFFNDFQFRASWMTFNIDDAAYFCIELLESAIRKKLNPLIGKQ